MNFVIVIKNKESLETEIVTNYPTLPRVNEKIITKTGLYVNVNDVVYDLNINKIIVYGSTISKLL